MKKNTNNRLEKNIMIVIYATKRIMDIFLGPFLTAYFIKTSSESIIDLSIHYIFAYIVMAVTCYFVAKIIKNKFKIGMFRIGVICNFIYIMAIIILKQEIVNHLLLMSILFGISAATFWFPYNMFSINKVENSDRTNYTVKTRVVSSIVGVICPILLGGIISITNYVLTAVIIAFISLMQIILSFVLTPDLDTNLPEYNIKNAWNKLKNNVQVKKSLMVEFFIGMNINDGALQTLITLLVFNSFKTDLNLGIITSIVTIATIFVMQLYGKIYSHKDDKKLIIISGIIPVLSLLLLFIRNNVTIILYNFCFVIFTNILSLAKEIRLYNLSNSCIVDRNNQAEFLTIREGSLNFGRVISYSLLLGAKLFENELILNIVMVLLTFSILATGLNIIKVDKNEDDKC